MNIRAKETPESSVGLESLVSTPLRIELHYEMYSPTLTLHAWFNKYNVECPQVVRKICHSAMVTSHVSNGDILFHYGETSSSMLMCKRGSLCYFYGENEVTVGAGMWLTEAALWTHWVHRGMLAALDDSTMFQLDADSFQNIVSTFEISTKSDPAAYARNFVAALNTCTEEDVTDLPLRESLANTKVYNKLVVKQVKANAADKDHASPSVMGRTLKR